jgi:ribonuclease HI
MGFDGAVSKEGEGAGVWIRPPSGEPKLLSDKLYFDCTNNVVQYEALVFGLKTLRDLLAKKIEICGDSELVIKKVQGSYQAKHLRLRTYMNLVLDLLEGFKEH